MDNQPLVSVGIPTYNRPEGLRRTLECITQQTYKNLEIIVSDNCSTNVDVQTVINEFISDKRIKYFRQPENKGPLYNFKFVLENANGFYFKWLADDDWIDLDYIEGCVNILVNKSDYSAAYGSAKLYSIQNEYLKEDAKINMEQSDPEQRVKYYFQNVLNNGAFYGIVRREIMKKIKLSNILADDWLIVARIAFIGRFKLLENTNCYLTIGGSSQSIESLVNLLKLPNYVKHLPYLVVCISIFKDILWKSSVYRELHLIKRLKFAFECSKIIWVRHNVKSELIKAIKWTIKYVLRIPLRLYNFLVRFIRINLIKVPH